MTPVGYELIAFASTADPARAAGFYRDTLGLRLVSESPSRSLRRARNSLSVSIRSLGCGTRGPHVCRTLARDRGNAHEDESVPGLATVSPCSVPAASSRRS